MPRGWRSWTVVLRALQRLGVDKYAEDDVHVYVARFPHAGQAIRRWHLPKEVEAHLIRKLGIDRERYEEAIRAVEAEDRAKSPDTPPPAPPPPDTHALSLTASLARIRELVEDGAIRGDSALDLCVDESFDITALIREAQDRRDDLHLALEQQIHPVMLRCPSLTHVTLRIPTIEPFSIGRPGHDD